MAITRIWIAERDPKSGELSSCEPPTNLAVRPVAPDPNQNATYGSSS